MSSFYLVGGDEIKCQSCDKSYDVEWDTEYGDSIFGDHDKECPNCGKIISFNCRIEYTTLEKKKE